MLRSLSPTVRLRRVASLAFWLILAGASMRLAACSGLDPNPPNPHDNHDGDPPADGGDPDASDAADGSP